MQAVLININNNFYMKWIKLNEPRQLDEIREQSTTKTILIFKHSTRCSVSRTALDRLERNWNTDEMQEVELYFLDLLSYRDISNQIAHQFDIEHESPQVMLIRNKAVVYNSAHFEIDYSSLVKKIKQD
jgi:bacillithiol system protein YtxJ